MGYYIIIGGSNFMELERGVNENLQAGLRCQGGPFLAQHSEPDEFGEALWWWQAMVRE